MDFLVSVFIFVERTKDKKTKRRKDKRTKRSLYPRKLTNRRMIIVTGAFRLSWLLAIGKKAKS